MQGNSLLVTTENVAQALSLDQVANSPVATPSTPEASTTADIVIIKSKPKNPDYKVWFWIYNIFNRLYIQCFDIPI